MWHIGKLISASLSIVVISSLSILSVSALDQQAPGFKSIASQTKLSESEVSLIHTIWESKQPVPNRVTVTESDRTGAGTGGGEQPRDSQTPASSSTPTAALGLPSSIQPYKQQYTNISNKYNLPGKFLERCKEVSAKKEERRNSPHPSTPDLTIRTKDFQENLYFYEAVLSLNNMGSDKLSQVGSLYLSLLSSEILQPHSILTEQGLTSQALSEISNFGFNSDESSLLSILLKDDTYLTNCTDLIDTIADYQIPYTYGQQTISNFISISTSLVNKVRYVWGGGHGNANHIVGISPMWALYNQAYIDNNKANECIQPMHSWCPIHGELENSECTCLDTGGDQFNTPEQYIASRAKAFNVDTLETGKYSQMLNKADIYTPVLSGHRLDGLDCSGYVGWVTNQLTSGSSIDSDAKNFTTANSTIYSPLSNSSVLYPGDIISWSTHIVLVIGALDPSSFTEQKNNGTYLIIEMSPVTVQFSVMYNHKATSSDIQSTKQLASEMNKAFGDLSIEPSQIHTYEIENENKQFNPDGTEFNKFADDRSLMTELIQPRADLKLSRNILLPTDNTKSASELLNSELSRREQS